MKQILLTASLLVLLGGCATRSMSNTPRTAIEQLLLSAAVDAAVQKFVLREVAGKKVHIDFANLSAYDAEYIKVAVRARFAELGATLLDKPDEAEYVAEVASGGLGNEYKSFLIGIPSLPVPGSPVPLPEVALYKKVEQTGIMKLLIFVHANGNFVALDQYYARADRDESFLFWFRSVRKDDIREGWERADLKLEDRPQQAKD
ncbi:MAG: DUF6655 family protein [Planctomycetota bacterium]|jgi:hypothetical protein